MTEYLYTVDNPNTSTRHVADGAYGNPICGTLPHAIKHSKSPLLGQFPQDFGDLPGDCPNCTKLVGPEHVVQEGN